MESFNKLLKTIIFIFFLACNTIFIHANETSNNFSTKELSLEKALTKDEVFSQNITSQTGAYLPNLYKQNYLNKAQNPLLETRIFNTNIGFEGIGSYSSDFKYQQLEGDSKESSPAFMFTFKKQGDSLKFGGELKGVTPKSLSDIIFSKPDE